MVTGSEPMGEIVDLDLSVVCVGSLASADPADPDVEPFALNTRSPAPPFSLVISWSFIKTSVKTDPKMN